MLHMRIRKNDLVQIMNGKERGKTGKLLKVDPDKNKVKVEKLNLVKRHVKPTQKNPQGGTSEKEAWLHISNVLPVCPKCNRGVRVKKQTVKEKKVRACVKCGEVLDKK